MLERTLPRRNLASVEQFNLPIAADDRHAQFTLARPGETVPEPLSVEALGPETYGIAIRNVTTRGNYRVTAHRAESAANEGSDAKLWEVPLSVNGPEQESDLTSLDEKGLEDRLGEANYRWVPAGSTISLEGAHVRGHDLWRWLMLAVLACLLAELFVLYYWGRPKPVGVAAV
jgi:hypothetical protein